MAIITDSAVALRRIDYSETSQIVVLFTRDHGKIRVIAKGIKRSTKKRFATGLDLLDVGRATIRVRGERPSGLANMTEWKQTQSFNALREELFRVYAGLYAAEVTAQLTEDWDAHPGLYEALVHLLDRLCQASTPIEPIVDYQTALLLAIGSGPMLTACVTCGKTANLTHFSSIAGGMVCRSCSPACAEKRSVSAPTLKALQQRPADPMPEGAFALLNYHLTHLMGKESLLAAKLLSPSGKKMLRQRRS